MPWQGKQDLPSTRQLAMISQSHYIIQHQFQQVSGRLNIQKGCQSLLGDHNNGQCLPKLALSYSNQHQQVCQPHHYLQHQYQHVTRIKAHMNTDKVCNKLRVLLEYHHKSGTVASVVKCQ